MFCVAVLNKARRQLRKIAKRQPSAYHELLAAIDSLALWPDVPNVKKLTGHQYGYRLRLGNYRILFDVQQDVRVIEVQEVKKRDERTY